MARPDAQRREAAIVPRLIEREQPACRNFEHAAVCQRVDGVRLAGAPLGEARIAGSRLAGPDPAFTLDARVGDQAVVLGGVFHLEIC